MLPNGKQRLFFSCFTVSSTSCRTGFTCFSTLSVRLLKLYSCFPTLSIGFIKSLQITVFARKNTQPCHTVRRVSDLKSAQHKKSSSAATWIFCMEPIRFGIIKGDQPLIRNGDDRGQRPKQGGAVGAAACRMRVPRKARSRRREPQPAASRASKVAGAFLVLFWHAKENISGGNAFCKRRKISDTRLRSAREASSDNKKKKR